MSLPAASPSLSDTAAAAIGRQLLQLCANLAPISIDLEAQIPAVLDAFDYRLASALLAMRREYVTPEDLHDGALELLTRLVADPKLTAIADQFMIAFRAGYQLVLALNDCVSVGGQPSTTQSPQP